MLPVFFLLPQCCWSSCPAHLISQFVFLPLIQLHFSLPTCCCNCNFIRHVTGPVDSISIWPSSDYPLAFCIKFVSSRMKLTTNLSFSESLSSFISSSSCFLHLFKQLHHYHPSLIMTLFLFLAFWLLTGAAQITCCRWMINLFNNFFFHSRVVQAQHGFLPNVCEDISVHVRLVNSFEAVSLSIYSPGVQHQATEKSQVHFQRTEEKTSQ